MSRIVGEYEDNDDKYNKTLPEIPERVVVIKLSS